MNRAAIILFCLVASFFFSGMETGVLLLNRTRIRYLKERGSIGAMILMDFFLHHPSRLSSTVLVGNTIVNGFSTVLVVQWFLRTDGLPGAIGAAILFACILWFFGELIPKALFRRFPNRLTTFLAPLLLLSFLVLWPIIQVFVTLSQFVVTVMGGKITSRQMFVTRDELKLMAREGKESVQMTGEQRNLIASILDSQSATAKDIMKPKDQVITVDESTPLADRIALSVSKNYSRFPVVSKSSNKWDTLWVAYDSLFGVEKRRDPPTVFPETNLEEILRILRNSKSPMAIVRSHLGHDLGIVTVEDVIRRYVGKIDL